MATRFADQVSEGMDVYDVNDDKIGTVEEIYDAAARETSASGGGYLRVPTGFLGLGREHHIPFSAIGQVRDQRIHLSIARDRLDELEYDRAPTETTAELDDMSLDRTTTTTQTTTNAPKLAAEPRSSSVDNGAQRRLQLREEELVARKRAVHTGDVQLRTEVVSEQQTLEVPVTREEVTIERREVARRPSDRSIGAGETVEVPVREEQVQLDKQTVVYEEVNVGKQAVEETQHLSERVRREEAVVEEEGKVDVRNQSTPPRSNSR
jgi:uncharacterized protein (TIGR02271 family)